MGTWVWVFIVIVVLLVVFISLFKLSASQNWEETQGNLVSISIEEITHNHMRQETGSDGRFDYKINLDYQYSVDGKTYTGNVLMVGVPNVFDRASDAENVVKKYSNLENIDVFFNPQNPQDSALMTAKNIPIVGFVIMFLMVVCIGGGIIFLLNSGLLAD
jgi:hypothetical protein